METLFVELVNRRSLCAGLRAQRSLPERIALAISVQLARAQRNLHALGVAHCALRSENVMCPRLVVDSEEPDVEIFSFGAAWLFNTADMRNSKEISSVGPPTYAPLRALHEQLHDIASAGVYSLGMVFSKMLAVSNPFATTTTVNQKARAELFERKLAELWLEARVWQTVRDSFYTLLTKTLSDKNRSCDISSKIPRKVITPLSPTV